MNMISEQTFFLVHYVYDNLSSHFGFIPLFCHNVWEKHFEIFFFVENQNFYFKLLLFLSWVKSII